MRKPIILLALIAALWPAAVAAQSPDTVGTRIQIDSDADIDADERVGTVIVINGDALIDGTVIDDVFVVDGDARISGTVEGQITTIEGDVYLLDGSIDETDLTAFWAVLGALSIVLWVGLTIALLVAGILFALMATRQFNESKRVMTGEAVNTIVGIIVVWIALPIAASLAIVTIVGLPLGLGVLLFVLPVLAFLGFLVAAARLGTAILRLLKQEPGEKPVLDVILGVLLLQLIVLIPFLGWVVVTLAAIWGAGALAVVAYHSLKGRKPDAEPEPEPVLD
jgi:hypothetical protein